MPPSGFPRHSHGSAAVGSSKDNNTDLGLSELRPLPERFLDGTASFIPEQGSVELCSDSFLTLRPAYKMARSSSVRNRRETALALAADGLHRAELKELGLLEELVNHLLKGNFLHSDQQGATETKTVYSFDSQRFIQLNYALRRLLDSATPLFRLTGKKLPGLPDWGDVGTEFLSENDFEIVAVAYHAQVEHFLTRVSDAHDFLTGDIRNAARFASNTSMPVRTDRVRSPEPLESISTVSHKSSPSVGRGSADTLPRGTRCISDLWERQSDSDSEQGSGRVRLDSNDPDPGDGSSDDDARNPRRTGNNQSSCRAGPAPPVALQTFALTNASGFQFAMRLKFDIVPTWDGDTDQIVRWINQVNDLARYSKTIRKQLGSIVPRRFQGSAQVWYYSLPRKHREYLEADWKLLRQEIAAYYMNRRWMETMRRRATRAYFREPGHVQETPSEYFIRKNDFLTTVFELQDSELIMEIMDGAPSNWATVLSPRTCTTATELQSEIKYYEDVLMDLDFYRGEQSNDHSESLPVLNPPSSIDGNAPLGHNSEETENMDAAIAKNT